jgi:hypothetical protein
MWHEFDAIIVPCLVGKKNSYFLIILLAQWLMFEIIFSYIIFKGRKTNAMVKFPLQPKSPRFKPFFGIFFILEQNGWK